MNDDDKQLLSMLYRYSQRRMVVSLGLVQAHFLGDAEATRRVAGRLERQGLVYVDGVTVRLTFPGFAHAVSLAAVVPAAASVHPLRGPAAPLGSRAA